MKHTIEDIIRDNREKFDEQVVPLDFISSFEQRLITHRRKSHRMHFSVVVSTLVAAAVALVIVLTIPREEKADTTNQTITELQQYYEGMQHRTISIIEKLLDKVDQQTRTEIRAEIAQMQKDDIEFRRQINKMLPSEQYIAYEVEYYQTRQTSLEYIQSILQTR